MLFHIIRPNYTIDDETYEIKIKGFFDENETLYKSFEELFAQCGTDTKFFCYMYQPTIAELEKWGDANAIPRYPFNKQLARSGRPSKKNSLCLCHATMKMHSTPQTVFSDIIYNGSRFLFFNIEKWFPHINNFNPSINKIGEQYAVLERIETDLMPLYTASNTPPATLSKLSRSLNPSLQKNPEKASFLLEIKTAYTSGFNYINRSNIIDKLFYCDVNSMYTYIMTNRIYPMVNRMPRKINGLQTVDNERQLALYHISYLKASVKMDGFPSIFCQKETQKRMGISNNRDFEWECNDAILGWITSIDYDLLYENYNVEIIDIDISYVYSAMVHGSTLFGTKIVEFFNKKQNAEDEVERAMYKGILNTLSGSIGMSDKFNYKVDNILCPTKFLSLKNSADQDKSFNNWDISAFMTAYARQYIIKLAHIAGYENVACIITDAVVVKDISPLLPHMGKGLGELSLDRTMYNAHWWRVSAYEWQDEDGNWKAKIAGLPKDKYKHGTTFYVIPKIMYNREKHYYYKDFQEFPINEEDF